MVKQKKKKIKKKIEKRISYLTYGQARSRGITKKRWIRAVNIKEGIKRSKNKKIIESQGIIKKPKRETQEKIYIPKDRYRKQVVLNYVNREETDTGLIFLSVRAMTINPDINHDGLKIAVNEAKKILESQAGISLSNYQSFYYGHEPPTKIGSTEDLRLNDMKVHIEFFYNGKVMKTYTII